MATIPRIVAQRSLDPGGVVQYPTGDPVGQALEQAGTKAQSLVTHYQDRVNQQERFQALIGFDEFGGQLANDTETAKQTMKPGAMGLHDTLLETYDKRSQEWLSQIPESQRPEFAARIKAKRETFSLGAARLENAESQRYQVSNIETRLGLAKNGILQAGPDAIGTYQKDVEELIDSSTLTPVQKEEAKRKVKVDLQETGFRALASRDPSAAQNVAAGWGVGGGVDKVVERIVGVESGGNDNAKNPTSSAAGAGQFINSTWLSTVGKYRPDLMQGRSEAEVLALRSNGALSREMTRHLAMENAATLSSAGITPTAGNVYLAHFLGPDGAKKVLSADPNTPVAGIVGQAAVSANSSILAGKTAGEVAAWAATKMGAENKPVAVASADPRFADIPADRRMVLGGAADLEVRKRAAELAAAETQTYNNRLNDLQTKIIDNQATMADVQKARQDGWLKDAGDIQRVSNQIAARDKGIADVSNFGQAFANPNFAWNHYDKGQRDWIEAGFKQLGGDIPALQSIVDRTGIVPASAATVLRGSLASNDPTRVANAMTAASNLMAKNPAVFEGIEGKTDIENNALAFRQYTEHYGMTDAEAAKKVIQMQSPEYKRQVDAKIKAEDVDAIIKKNVQVSDLTSAFNEGVPLLGRPTADFTPAARQVAMSDFAELFRDRYLETGDVTIAKAQAVTQLKKVWGVSYIGGGLLSGNLMRYPPDRAPAYRGIPDAADQIASQAIDVIKAETGKEVSRAKLIIAPLDGGQTSRSYTTNNPPPYSLSWFDDNGTLQTLSPGKAFVADPASMKQKLTADRKRQFDTMSEAAAMQDMDLPRANFGVR